MSDKRPVTSALYNRNNPKNIARKEERRARLAEEKAKRNAAFSTNVKVVIPKFGNTLNGTTPQMLTVPLRPNT